jgi:hypothetical protein
LEREFDGPQREVKQGIWDRFIRYYDLIGTFGLFVKYPEIWFTVQGLVSPRQIIDWREFISIIGEDVFNKIPLALNYNSEQENIFFLKEYDKHFAEAKNLIITLACGYFWKFLKGSQRRQKMAAFYMDNVENGNEVNIYTKDKTLKKEFTSHKKLTVKSLPYRMDLHYTMVQPKNHKKKEDEDKTLVFVELPHTEKTDERLEAYFTIGDLRKFGCSDKNIKRLLWFLKSQSCLIPHFLLKSIPSKIFSVAINWEGL